MRYRRTILDPFARPVRGLAAIILFTMGCTIPEDPDEIGDTVSAIDVGLEREVDLRQLALAPGPRDYSRSCPKGMTI